MNFDWDAPLVTSWDWISTIVFGLALGLAIFGVIVALLRWDDHRQRQAFAQRLRTEKLGGHKFNDAAVDRLLELSNSYDYMVRLAWASISLAEADKDAGSQ